MPREAQSTARPPLMAQLIYKGLMTGLFIGTAAISPCLGWDGQGDAIEMCRSGMRVSGVAAVAGMVADKDKGNADSSMCPSTLLHA